MINNKELPQWIIDKWKPVLDMTDEDIQAIREKHKHNVTPILLESPHIKWWDDNGNEHITQWCCMTPEQREEAERNREKHNDK